MLMNKAHRRLIVLALIGYNNFKTTATKSNQRINSNNCCHVNVVNDKLY